MDYKTSINSLKKKATTTIIVVYVFFFVTLFYKFRVLMRVCSWDVNTNQSQDSGERGWSVFIRIDKLGRVWNFTQ